MLSSTKDYIEALRAGKYLRFLEWPYFIALSYYEDPNRMGADDLVPLLIYELIHNGFGEEDAKKVALLEAASEQLSLSGKWSYSLTSIASAVFECMVYDSKGLKHRFEDARSRDQILKFMKTNSPFMEKATFGEALQSQQSKFFEWAKHCDKKLLKEAQWQMSPIIVKRTTVENYIYSLKVSSTSDPFYQTRLSMVASLADYLNLQTELTPEVTEEIANYANKIREMQPLGIEHFYLDSISPLSLLEVTWRLFSSFSQTMFSILQKPESTSTETSAKENRF